MPTPVEGYYQCGALSSTMSSSFALYLGLGIGLFVLIIVITCIYHRCKKAKQVQQTAPLDQSGRTVVITPGGYGPGYPAQVPAYGT